MLVHSILSQVKSILTILFVYTIICNPAENSIPSTVSLTKQDSQLEWGHPGKCFLKGFLNLLKI